MADLHAPTTCIMDKIERSLSVSETIPGAIVSDDDVSRVFGDTVHAQGRLLYPYENVDDKVLHAFHRFRGGGDASYWSTELLMFLIQIMNYTCATARSWELRG